MYTSDKFFTEFALSYEEYASTKKSYLSTVNDFIKTETSAVKTIADIGSGDGKRGKMIAELLNVNDIIFFDNSDGMISLAKNIPNANVEKSDIFNCEFKKDKRFDIVLCLWNVLGHIEEDKRLIALKNIVSLVDSDGFIFLDVNNRYNIANYGIRSVIKNIIKDIFYPKKSNGDFNLIVDIKGVKIDTIVHIFSPFEIENLFKLAGLSILKRRIVDYKTGGIRKYFWEGQLVYKLKKI